MEKCSKGTWSYVNFFKDISAFGSSRNPRNFKKPNLTVVIHFFIETYYIKLNLVTWSSFPFFLHRWILVTLLLYFTTVVCLWWIVELKMQIQYLYYETLAIGHLYEIGFLGLLVTRVLPPPSRSVWPRACW